MIWIKETLEKIILENSFLEEAMFYDFLNISSFAEYIQPQVQKITKKNITIWAIKMALCRISKNDLKEKIRFETKDFFIKKNISIICLEKNIFTKKFLSNIEKSNFWESEYFSIIESSKEINLVFSSEIEKNFDKKTLEKHQKIKIQNLAVVWINVWEDMTKNFWMFYEITKKLAFYWVNIIEIISTYTELCFIFEEKDLKKALEVLV